MENENTEFKESWHDEYLKTLSGFANAEGGKLFLGIDDNGKVIGIKDLKRLFESIPNKAKDIIGIIPSVKSQKKNGKYIIIVSIDASHAAVSYHGRYYKRSGSTTLELTGNALTRFLITKTGKLWDSLIEEKATIKDISPETIEKFKKLSSERFPNAKNEKSIMTLLKKLELAEGNKLTKAAILLFGKNPQHFFHSSYIKVGKFVTDSDVVSSNDVEGNLFSQVDAAVEIIKTKYLISKIRYEGLYRKEDLEYPENALREAIINAVIHRDYIGTHTHIRIYSDKLNIWNEGILPPEIKIEDLKKKHSSRPRNELLAKTFYKAGLIESWGKGTIGIVESFKKAGLPEPEYKEEQCGFSVYFYKDIYTEENLQKMGLNDRQIKAVWLIKEKGKITNRAYRELTTTSKPTATRDLSELVKKNILEMSGQGKRDICYKIRKSLE